MTAARNIDGNKLRTAFIADVKVTRGYKKGLYYSPYGRATSLGQS